jgi:protein-disulfide isomerase
LCGIARNLARKARKRTDREAACEDVVAPDANPFDATAQAEVDRVVREALARVPDTYRETLVLYYCENRSVREVADALGIAEATAMQRLTRGRRYLADGVNALVERSLRGARRSRNLAAAVVAALPLAVPSRVDASTPAEGSTMVKIAIAAAVIAAVGTSALAVRHYVTDDSPPTAAVVATPQADAAQTKPVTGSMTSPAPALPAAKPAAAMQADDDDDNRVIDRPTIARLALERGPSRGPANAPVTIILFQDLMCKYCGTVLGTIDQLWDEYPGKLRLVIKQLPVHKEARLAAEASFAADAQGKFWEMHDLMIAHQDDLSREALLEYGKQAGLDVGKLANALDRHTYADALKKDIDSAQEIGVHATPEFLINGEDVRGARSIEEFRKAIDAALAAK